MNIPMILMTECFLRGILPDRFDITAIAQFIDEEISAFPAIRHIGLDEERYEAYAAWFSTNMPEILQLRKEQRITVMTDIVNYVERDR